MELEMRLQLPVEVLAVRFEYCAATLRGAAVWGRSQMLGDTECR